MADTRWGAPLVHRSTPQAIAQELRAAIVEGRIPPGEPLRQDVLAQHFAVSRIPVREALRQLESEGWIDFLPNKGASVRRLDADDVRELYEMRAALESLALRAAMSAHTAATLRLARKAFDEAHAERDPEMYARRNECFHMALYAPAARPRLLELIRTLHQRGERYLRLKLGVPQHKKQSDEEHRQLLQLVCARNAVGAEALLSRHLLRTGDLLDALVRDRLAPTVVPKMARA